MKREVTSSTLSRIKPYGIADVTITAFYALLIGILTIRHELWPDEVQQWLLARQSHGLGELFHNRRYEGHPLLWYIILYPVAHLSANVEAIKPINFGLSIVAAYLTLHHFTRGVAEKILFLLAPLPIFYFSVVTRPYMLGYLLVVLLCLAMRRPDRDLRIFVLIGFLANIHIYFLIAASAFLLYYLLLRGLPSTTLALPRRFWLGLSLCLALIGLSVWQIIPPPDESSSAGHRVSLDIASAMYGLAMGPFLGSNKSFGMFLLLLSPFVSLIYITLRNSPLVGVFLLVSTLGILAFQSLVYGGAAWHAGIVYVCIQASVFMMRDCKSLDTQSVRRLDYTFMAMLLLHAASGLILLRALMTTPCSNDKYVAAYLKSYCPVGCTIISDDDFWGVPISGYLGGQPIYYVSRQEFGTFGILDSHRFLPHGIEEVVRAAHRFEHPIMLVGHRPTAEEESRFDLRLIQEYSGSMTPREAYYIYVFTTR